MKKLYVIIAILCAMTLVVSCGTFGKCKKDKSCSLETGEKAQTEHKCTFDEKRACTKEERKACKKAGKTCKIGEKKACPHASPDGQPCAKCAQWDTPDNIKPFCPDIGSFLDKDVKALEKTAWDAYQAKDFEKAAKYYLAYLRYNVTDERNIYNLACCYGLLGKPELAAKYIERAYKSGFADVTWIKEDPDFDKVRESDVFKTAIAKLEEEMNVKKAESGQVNYIKTEFLNNCHIMLPEGFDANKSYNLIVGLHGFGGTAEIFTGVYKKFEKPDFIFVTPQAPYAFPEESRGLGYSWGLMAEDEKSWEAARPLVAKYIADVIGYMKGKYKIGDVYLLGFSQGGSVAYGAGIKNHELLKGIIAFGAPFDEKLFKRPDINLDAAKHLQVFIAHGNDDPLVKLEDSQNAAKMFGDLGYPLTIYNFEGGHEVPESAIHEVQKWLMAK